MIEKALDNPNLYPILPRAGGDLEQVILHHSSLILFILNEHQNTYTVVFVWRIKQDNKCGFLGLLSIRLNSF